MRKNAGGSRHNHMRPCLRTALHSAAATVLFAAVHSLLASDRAKRIAAEAMGTASRKRYRQAYNAQALATSVGLYLWLRLLPNDNVVYQIQGPAAYGMRVGQAAAAVQLARCLSAVGVRNFLGSNSQDQSIEAQGPARRHDGTLVVVGPFQTQRHPTNFWPVVLLWLQPRMKWSGLAFSVVASLYLYLGSLHQDHRLRRAYGDEYERYRASGVPLFLPSLTRIADVDSHVSQGH